MKKKRLSFIDHLEELRKRILYALGCVVIFSILGFFFAPGVLNLIIKHSQIAVTYFFSPMEAFTAQIKVAISLGVIVSFPFLLYQTWAFIGPGLTKKERKISLAYLGSGLILFITGMFFGYFVLIKFGLTFLLSFGTEYLQPLINIGKYLNFIIWCLLGAGLLFQLPLLLFFLMKLGILDVDLVRRHRPEAVIAILLICAVITPTGDLFTLMLISIPLLILFELSIFAARLTKKKNNRA